MTLSLVWCFFNNDTCKVGRMVEPIEGRGRTITGTLDFEGKHEKSSWSLFILAEEAKGYA